MRAQFASSQVADLQTELRSVCAKLPRRFDRLSELTLLASAHVMGDAPPHETGLYFATAAGNLSGTMTYLQRLKDKGGHFANPIDFPNLLMSAPAANVSLHLGIKGVAMTFHQGEVGALHALALACEALQSGRVRAALVVEAEENSEWHTRMTGQPGRERTAALRVEHGEALAGDVVIRNVKLGVDTGDVCGNFATCVGAVSALKPGQTTTIFVRSDVHGSAAVTLEKL